MVSRLLKTGSLLKECLLERGGKRCVEREGECGNVDGEVGTGSARLQERKGTVSARLGHGKGSAQARGAQARGARAQGERTARG